MKEFRMKTFKISNETALNSNRENALASIRVEMQDMANDEGEIIAIICDGKAELFRPNRA